jgi:hypothetical protein
MGNRTAYIPRAHGHRREYIDFSFTAPGAGTSVVIATQLDGCDSVLSIAHVAATNLLTVTLKDAYHRLVDASASVVGVTGDRAQIGTITNEASSLPLAFQITTWSGAGVAVNDSAARITVSLAVRNGTAVHK